MSQQYKAQLPLAVTLGEPAGIGPELLLDVAGQVAAGNQSIPPFLVIGDAGHLKSVADKTDRPFRSKILPDFFSFDPQATDVLQIVETTARVTDTDFGQPNPANCQMVVEAIDRAVAATLDGQARAVVTSPIHKHTMYTAGFKFPGHTEYLAERCEKALGREFTPVMMMAGPELRTVPATIHIPLADVAAQLTAGLIEQTASIVLQALEQQFGIQAPRLAVAGLNPHAGEDGAMGREEIDIVMPALENLRQRGYPVQGPLAADSLFHAAARTTYDAVLTMYHDQALIPAKMLGFDETVNVTLGLPLVRTSPDHGTAFDIAGKGIARPAALLAAMRMAAQLTTSQRGVSPQ